MFVVNTRWLHWLVQELVSLGIRRRAELPQRRGPRALSSGGGGDGEQDCIDCQGFVRRGACRMFNEQGRCSNHHPLDVHIVEIPRQRCPQVSERSNLLLIALSGLTTPSRCTPYRPYSTLTYGTQTTIKTQHSPPPTPSLVFSILESL